ncbi:MAG: response regulator [Gemmatimonadota bacterium]
MNKRALTTGEVAGYLGVNFRTVIRWIERGHLRAYKLPGRGDNRVTVEDFLDFLRRNQMPVPPELQPEPDPAARRVLVVEDEPAMAQAIERVLRQAGFEVRVAHDGFAAGALFSILAPAVVTLDLRMPGMHGTDVLRFLRQTDGLQATRVLVVSALPRAELEAAVAAGADDYLEKPFTNQELLAKVRRLTGVTAP